MKIKGTSKPQCSLCRFFDKEGKICEKTQSETTPKNSCREFIYDIFKYTPSAGHDFGKFSKEDFEI